jgi:hypothetical protein
MMGERTVMQEALFVGFSIERHVPGDHLLRKIDRFVDLSGVRAHVAPYYSDVGPSIDPELLIRMLLVGPRHRQDRGLRHLPPGAEEGRDAVRPPQTHPQTRPTTTTRALRRP